MLKTFLSFAFIFVLQSWTVAHYPSSQELATSYSVVFVTSISLKPSPCFVTYGFVSQCRRKRGMEEKPEIVIQSDEPAINPTAVSSVEVTPAPKEFIAHHDSDSISSSIDEFYLNTMEVFRQLSANNRHNMISVGNCGQSNVNLSQFLSCLGINQHTATTLTATVTKTLTYTTGYITMFVGGCTPVTFPYSSCPSGGGVTNYPYPPTYFPTSYVTSTYIATSYITTTSYYPSTCYPWTTESTTYYPTTNPTTWTSESTTDFPNTGTTWTTTSTEFLTSFFPRSTLNPTNFSSPTDNQTMPSTMTSDSVEPSDTISSTTSLPI